MNNIIPFYEHSNIILDRSRGCYLYDTQGNRYIDFEAGVWCENLGHNNEQINKSIEKQIRKSIHIGYHFKTRPAEVLSRELQRLIGYTNGASVFLSSGSEAVILAITLAQHLTMRKKVLKIDNTFISSFGIGKIGHDNDSLVNVKNNNSDLLENIDFREIAAFVLETGGASIDIVRFPDYKFIKQLVELARKNGCLIIADEVTTGMGRMGKWFGFQYYDLMPDIVVTGKALGNGFPISGITINSEVSKGFEQNSFKYAQSHQNDPLGCTIGLEVIKIIENNNLVEKANKTGEYFMNRLESIRAKYSDIIEDVRGRGLMLALEFAPDFKGKKIKDFLFKNGFVVGFKRNTLRFIPPLIIKKRDIDIIIETISISCQKYG